MDKKVIILTGATGFMGSHLAGKLVAEGFLVLAMVRTESLSKTEALRQAGVSVAVGDFGDAHWVDSVFAANPVHGVIHLAALRGAGLATRDEYHRVNVAGTETMLAAAHQHRGGRFIYCSSVGVFGASPVVTPAGLSTPCRGDNRYHLSKIRAEEKVREYISRGLDACIVRPTITYGTEDNGFARILISLVKKRKLFLPFTANTIHLLSVDGFCETVLKILGAARLDERIFILADAWPVPLPELADMIHFYYYQKKYPPYLRLPDWAFRGLQVLFEAVRNEKWATRMQLLSRDWYYDVSRTEACLGVRLRDTKIEFQKMLATLR